MHCQQELSSPTQMLILWKLSMCNRFYLVLLSGFLKAFTYIKVCNIDFVFMYVQKANYEVILHISLIQREHLPFPVSGIFRLRHVWPCSGVLGRRTYTLQQASFQMRRDLQKLVQITSLYCIIPPLILSQKKVMSKRWMNFTLNEAPQNLRNW